MRFAYDRFGMAPYGYEAPEYKYPRQGYRNPSTRGSVGLEGAMTQMPAPNGSIGSAQMAPVKEEAHKARSGAIGQYRAI